MSFDFDKEYKPTFLFRNKHLATIIPAIFGKRIKIKYSSEDFFLSDNDFLQLDWKYNQSNK